MFSYLNPLPTLPQYNGPYKVAITDYEIPISEIPSTSTTPNSQISTIKFRIYHPTTSNAESKEPVYWLPNPQKQWNEAFASFLGATSRWSPLVSRLWSITNYIKIPVIRNGPLLPSKNGTYPVCFFSHGLGGNTNIYSSIVGSLASCGVVTIVPEHRDGSSPTALIRNARGEIETTIPYQKLSHTPDAKVLNARNAQLRVRMWELELLYTVVKGMNEGKVFTNYAEDAKDATLDLKAQLHMQPGQVAWAGHSFGAATITQFVKSIFYHQYLPQHQKQRNDTQGWDWTPLYQTQAESDLVKQITPDSPVALLDIWTMPLRADTTSWLWERPMPCYSREVQPNMKTTTVAMISGEFYRYEGIFNRTRALLSRSPATAIEMIEGGKPKPLPPAVDASQSMAAATPGSPHIAEISKEEKPTQQQLSNLDLDTPTISTPTSSRQSSRPVTPTSSVSSPPSSVDPPNTNTENSALAPKFFHIPQSAHLSQSDFGPLFPNLTRYAMKAIEPHKTIELNVRAILGVMKGVGLDVMGLKVENGDVIKEEYLLDGQDPLSGGEKGEKPERKEIERRRKESERWVRVPLVE